ncbi:WD40 repeat-like protein [Lentinula raphanica]|nr:WD40 repeat-like protein [Lentinula raphanica]
MPIDSPPTPAPSPGPSNLMAVIYGERPSKSFSSSLNHPLGSNSTTLSPLLALPQNPALRRQYLSAIIHACTPTELLFISTTIAPLLKRDFLRALPPELALHVLRFVDTPKTLGRAAQVSQWWRKLVNDESLWKRMCAQYGFGKDRLLYTKDHDQPERAEYISTIPRNLSTPRHTSGLPIDFSYRKHFKYSYSLMQNWHNGGHLLQAHKIPLSSSNPEAGVVTSLALDDDWVVVGLANCRIHVFSAHSGILARTLVGHDLGVWAVCLVHEGGYMGGPDLQDRNGQQTGGSGSGMKNQKRKRKKRGVRSAASVEIEEDEDRSVSQSLGRPQPRSRHSEGDIDTINSNIYNCAIGSHISGLFPTNQANSSAVTDTDPPPHQFVPPSLRTALGYLGRAHNATNSSEGWGQPGALVVSGGCDKVVRVWDIRSGYCIYVLRGHTSTIRCMKVLHNRPIAVSGSRDNTLRVWDIQRGRMLRVLEGHVASVRCLDVCGNRVVSGSYDYTCRLWNVDTGQCLHVLQGHMSQVYSVAFDGVRIASGGMDTTVRVWDAETGECQATLQGHTALVCQLQLSPTMLATGGSDVLHRIAAHDSSVTSLQFDHRFLVTGGNDGRVRLFETQTGNYVRDLSEPSETVWKAAYGPQAEGCVIMCRRQGKTVLEFWSLKPRGERVRNRDTEKRKELNEKEKMRIG